MTFIPPAKLREVLFLFVYAMDFISQDNTYALSEMIMDELKVSRSAVRNVLSRAEAILKDKEWIDQMIADVIIGYRLDRLKTVERNVLRVAIFEMVKGVDEKGPLPPKVAITEAKRLAKKFATPQAAPFIHAVVAAIANKNDLGLTTHEPARDHDESEPLPQETDIQASLLKLEEDEKEEEQAANQALLQAGVEPKAETTPLQDVFHKEE